MNKKIFVLRIIETLFLVCFTYSISINDSSTDFSRGFLSFAFKFRIGSEPSFINFSIYPAGFALSLLGSVLMMGKVRLKYLISSIILAVCGLLELVSNSSAALSGNFFPFSLELPMLLCIIDWIVSFKLRKSYALHAGAHWIVCSTLALGLIILGVSPLYLINKRIQVNALESSAFLEAEVMTWIKEFDREHFDTISHSKMVEQSGGQKSLDEFWVTIESLTPFGDLKVSDSYACLIFDEATGVTGDSRHLITTRSPAHPSEIYFKVYCRQEGGVWTLYGFRITDKLEET